MQLLKDALHVRLHRVDGNAHQRGDFLVAASFRGKHGNRKLVGCERVGHLQRRNGVVNFHPPAAEAIHRLHNLVVRFRLLLAQRALHLPLQNAVMLHKRVDVPLAAGNAPRGIELLFRAFILLQAHADHAQDDVEVDAVNWVARARHQQGGFGNAHRVFVFAPDVERVGDGVHGEILHSGRKNTDSGADRRQVELLGVEEHADERVGDAAVQPPRIVVCALPVPLNHFEIPAALGGIPRLQHRHRVGNQRGQADFGALARQVLLADFAGFLVLIAEIVVHGAGDVAFLLVVHGQQEILEAVVARAGNQRHIALGHPRGDSLLPAPPALAQIRRMRRIRRNQPPARFPDCPLNPPGIQVVIDHSDGNTPQLRHFLYAEVVQCAAPPCSP